MLPKNEAEAKKQLSELFSAFAYSDFEKAKKIKRKCVMLSASLTGHGRPDLGNIFKTGYSRMRLKRR